MNSKKEKITIKTNIKEIILNFKKNDLNYLSLLCSAVFMFELIFDKYIDFLSYYGATFFTNIKIYIYASILLISIISLIEISKDKYFKFKNIILLLIALLFIIYKLTYIINNIDSYFILYPKKSTWLFKTIVNKESIYICFSTIVILLQKHFKKINN